MKKVVIPVLCTALFSCSTPDIKSISKQEPKPVTIQPAVQTKTVSLAEQEADLVKAYETQWKSVKLDTINGFPQYETYLNSLQTIFEDLTSVVKAGDGKLPKLKKLQGKLLDKLTQADHNYTIYGQPLYKEDITIWCKPALETVLNDPGSLDDEEYQLKGQSKKGWIVLMKYRAKNAFGAMVINVMKFELQYNAVNKVYNVISMK